MATYRMVLSVILSLIVFTGLSSCGSGSGAVDTIGLSQVTLRIDGMT
jgi:hypothetical protein